MRPLLLGLALFCIAAAPASVATGDAAYANNDLTTALTAWTDALVQARTDGDDEWVFELELRLAAAHRKADNSDTAHRLLQSAERHAQPGRQQNQVALAYALHWLHVGALERAEAAALLAFEGSQAAGDVPLAITSAYNLGVVRAQRGHRVSARRALEGAITLAQAAHSEQDVVASQVVLAQIALAEADVAAAAALAQPLTAHTGDVSADAHAILARIAELTGDAPTAVDHYGQALAHARSQRDVRRQAEWLSRLATLHLRQGRPDLADQEWRAAQEALTAWNRPVEARSVAIDRAVAQVDTDSLRRLHAQSIQADDRLGEARTAARLAERVGDKALAERAHTLADELNLMEVGWRSSRFLGAWWTSHGDPQRALPYLDEARSRVAVLRSLQAVSPADVDATQAALAEALLATGDTAGAVGALLQPPVVDPSTVTQWTDPSPVDRAELAAMRVAFSERVDRLRAEHPGLEQTTRIAPEQLEALQADLPAGTLVLSPIALDDRLVLLTLTQRDVRVTEVDVTRGDVERRIGRLVRALRAGLVDDDGWAMKQGQTLGEWLITPIEDQLHGVDTLVLTGGGPFRQLPTSLLHRGDALLTDSVALVHVTHAASLVQSQQTTAARSAVLIGNPDGSLPGAEAEVHAIAQLLPSVTTLTQDDATLAAVREASDGAGILHLATHGRINPEIPEHSHLVLGDTPLMYGQIPGLAPWLQDTKLVVLSACESGLPVHTQGVGADGRVLISIDGLASQFRRAGVDTLVASLWKVDDEATRALMETFYASMAQGQPVHTAMVTAQTAVRSDPRWEHPTYWAAFTVVGDWRVGIHR